MNVPNPEMHNAQFWTMLTVLLVEVFVAYLSGSRKC